MSSFFGSWRRIVVILAVALVWTGTALERPAAQTPDTSPASSATAPAAPPDSAETAHFASQSEAEQIAGLQKLLTADRQRQQALEEQLERLQREFDQASDEFTQLDGQRTQAQADRDTATSAAEKTQREQEAAALDQPWEQARRRFDLVIDRRKAVQEQLAILGEKIALEERVLKRLEEGESPELAQQQNATEPDDPAQAAPEPSPEPSPASSLLPGLPGLPASTAGQETDSSAQGARQSAQDVESAEELSQIDERVVEARRALTERSSQLQAARRELDEVDEGIALFTRDLQSAEQALGTARRNVQAAAQSVRELDARLAQQSDPDAAADETDELRRRLDEQRQQLEDARQDVAQQTARISESRAMLDNLQAARAAASEKVAKAADQVDGARRRLRFLASPLAPHRIWRWMTNSGPQILVVLLLMMVLLWLSRIVSVKVVAAVVRRSPRGTEAAREERAETLRRVFQNAAGLAILTLAVLAVLDISGLNVTVLLGGAAVIGAAVAFGAQNLIKDYFSGFMILIENQYSVGNVVNIAGIEGVVEDVTLRMTVLRDEEGTRHFIPHGQVNTVSNKAQGWSRAVFKIGIGYDEDVDHVSEVLMDLAREMRDDATFGPQILGQPEMQGVDALGESAVTIKFVIKTRPLKQWSVKREMLRRIKQRFAELGIEIPFPHRVVHYRDLREDPSPRDSTRGNGTGPDGSGA